VMDARSTTDLHTLLATTPREALHCSGLDHCVTRRCLMNSNQVDHHKFLFLSPLSLKKWVKMIMPNEFGNNGHVSEYVVNRHRALSEALKDIWLVSDAN
jgi:hypothetical protein